MEQSKKAAIQQIDTIIPNSNKHVKIDLQGKNLIITGGNGCGKTLFLKQIYQEVSAQIEQDDHKTADQLRKDLEDQIHFENSANRQSDKAYCRNEIDELKRKLSEVENVHVHLNDVQTYCSDFLEKKAVIRFFETVRQQSIAHYGSSDSIENIKNDEANQSLAHDSSGQFERYLIAFRTYKNDLIVEEGMNEEALIIELWFDKLNEQLCYLFEDQNLELKYVRNEQRFYIEQEGKKPYKLNELSSGYQSILSIYADLVMKVALNEVRAEELTGVVFIDEIDAHLHVSLQRKILSFFDQAFPNIQFIVTTHSPFVIQSVNNAVIYDLSCNEQLEDLSMYSYTAIIKGLLGVPLISNDLKQKIELLANKIQAENPDYEAIKKLVDLIEPNEEHLDISSRNILMQAEIALLTEHEKSHVED
jgi:AAA15 family ATPase/GTPase